MREVMIEKNRFSRLLEYLISTADIKNITLAQELQYDVSYISKWISGRMLPAEKSEKTILEGISKCIVKEASDEAKRVLLVDYQVDNLKDLEMAIFDNLEIEYFYVRDLHKNTGNNVAPKTFYYPELTMEQFIDKMRHPVLRRVKSLDIVAAMDLLSIEHEYQLEIIRFDNEHVKKEREYPLVHYSVLINIQPEKWDYIYDTMFLIYLLASNTCIDFQLYGETEATGRMVFAVEEDYAISGMLISKDRCISVVMSEEESNCNVIYRNIKTLCNRERLLFRKTTMQDMLSKHEYIHSMLSLKLQWMIGHMTEHFLPDDVFEEILDELENSGKLTVNSNELRSAHHMMKNIVEESKIKMLIEKSAFSRLIITNELDFYNHKVVLTAEQRSRFLEYFLLFYKTHENLEIRMLNGQFLSDYEYIYNQCMFLSDTVSYLRLNGDIEQNNLLIVNRFDIRKIFEKSFEAFWNYREGVVVSDKEMIISYIQHVVMGGI